MRRAIWIVVSLFALPVVVTAQWELQHSSTDASLRGIYAVNASVAWASGTGGTVLHTTDGGAHWDKCAVPPGAEKLDFRAVWAWSDQQAVAMSSGSGDQSRVYRTNDGCLHWAEELSNERKDGFWDALWYQSAEAGELVGDPIDGHVDRHVYHAGRGWQIDEKPCPAGPDDAAFAASNSSLFVFPDGGRVLGIGGKGGARVLLSTGQSCISVAVPLAGGNDSSGIFSVFFRDSTHGIAVGGDYKKSAETSGTAAFTADGGHHWTLSEKSPHGYRSAVFWSENGKKWVSVGTNGSDVSKDDGKTWEKFDDGEWNALSLPFAVGPKGRIGRLP